MSYASASATDTPMTAMVSAVAELSAVVMELSPFRVLAYRASIPAGLSGAEVVIETKDCEFELMVLTDKDAESELDKALLGPQKDAEALRSRRARVGELPPDFRRRAREAVCLLAEVVASAFGRRLAQNATVRRPVFVREVARLLSDSEFQAADVVLGDVRLVLVIATSGKCANRPVRGFVAGGPA
jgi:hypothetical protein